MAATDSTSDESEIMEDGIKSTTGLEHCRDGATVENGFANLVSTNKVLANEKVVNNECLSIDVKVTNAPPNIQCGFVGSPEGMNLDQNESPPCNKSNVEEQSTNGNRDTVDAFVGNSTGNIALADRKPNGDAFQSSKTNGIQPLANTHQPQGSTENIAMTNGGSVYNKSYDKLCNDKTLCTSFTYCKLVRSKSLPPTFNYKNPLLTIHFTSFYTSGSKSDSSILETLLSSKMTQKEADIELCSQSICHHQYTDNSNQYPLGEEKFHPLKRYEGNLSLSSPQENNVSSLQESSVDNISISASLSAKEFYECTGKQLQEEDDDVNMTNTLPLSVQNPATNNSSSSVGNKRRKLLSKQPAFITPNPSDVSKNSTSTSSNDIHFTDNYDYGIHSLIENHSIALGDKELSYRDPYEIQLMEIAIIQSVLMNSSKEYYQQQLMSSTSSCTSNLDTAPTIPATAHNDAPSVCASRSSFQEGGSQLSAFKRLRNDPSPELPTEMDGKFTSGTAINELTSSRVIDPWCEQGTSRDRSPLKSTFRPISKPQLQECDIVTPDTICNAKHQLEVEEDTVLQEAINLSLEPLEVKQTSSDLEKPKEDTQNCTHSSNIDDNSNNGNNNNNNDSNNNNTNNNNNNISNNDNKDDKNNNNYAANFKDYSLFADNNLSSTVEKLPLKKHKQKLKKSLLPDTTPDTPDDEVAILCDKGDLMRDKFIDISRYNREENRQESPQLLNTGDFCTSWCEVTDCTVPPDSEIYQHPMLVGFRYKDLPLGEMCAYYKPAALANLTFPLRYTLRRHQNLPPRVTDSYNCQSAPVTIIRSSPVEDGNVSQDNHKGKEVADVHGATTEGTLLEMESQYTQLESLKEKTHIIPNILTQEEKSLLYELDFYPRKQRQRIMSLNNIYEYLETSLLSFRDDEENVKSESCLNAPVQDKKPSWEVITRDEPLNQSSDECLDYNTPYKIEEPESSEYGEVVEEAENVSVPVYVPIVADINGIVKVTEMQCPYDDLAIQYYVEQYGASLKRLETSSESHQETLRKTTDRELYEEYCRDGNFPSTSKSTEPFIPGDPKGIWKYDPSIPEQKLVTDHTRAVDDLFAGKKAKEFPKLTPIEEVADDTDTRSLTYSDLGVQVTCPEQEIIMKELDRLLSDDDDVSSEILCGSMEEDRSDSIEINTVDTDGSISTLNNELSLVDARLPTSEVNTAMETGTCSEMEGSNRVETDNTDNNSNFPHHKSSLMDVSSSTSEAHVFVLDESGCEMEVEPEIPESK